MIEYQNLNNLYIRSILSLFLILLFGCLVEPYEPACVQVNTYMDIYVHRRICIQYVQTTYANVCYFKDGWESRCVTEGEKINEVLYFHFCLPHK